MLTNKKDIKNWLDKYGIEKYTINDDLTVDVHTNVDLSDRGLHSIDVQFNIINGNFYCYDNNLTSLKGCPRYVKDNFYCHKNNLNHLIDCPLYIGKNFYCYTNNITILEGMPKTIYGNFYCSRNELTSLFGGPEIIKGDFHCYRNKIFSFEYFPKFVENDIIFNINPVISFEHFDCQFNGSFSHVGTFIKNFEHYYVKLEPDLELQLSLSHHQLHKALLYNKLNNNIVIENKTTNKKLKI